MALAFEIGVREGKNFSVALRGSRQSFQWAVFSRAAARFGQDIGNTSGLFLILRGFAPLREIHGGGLAAQVGRFGETTLPVFIRRQKQCGR